MTSLLLHFVMKQMWAALFGVLLLFLIVATKLCWQADWPVARYDALLVTALLIQTAFLFFKLESWDEAKVIFAFHVVGTVMEIFKTAIGSWIYPEDNFFRIGGVPLFAGFMYSAVGSYIARAWHLFDLQLVRYPPLWMTGVLAAAIYLNFFTHHVVWDFRWGLFAAVAALYWKTTIDFKPFETRWQWPLLLAFFGIAVLIWGAENLATYGRAWVYPHQLAAWQPVAPAKIGSWFLLMIISFVLVALLPGKRTGAPGVRRAPAA